ncbi:MAG: alpha/beta hydrolase [Chitinophagaceae bacterium]|nr:MAG: alpha/beta hydrolase [Chitinophagaceae bacterium]
MKTLRTPKDLRNKDNQIRLKFRRFLIIVLSLLVVWIILGKGLILKNRISDQNAISLFEQRGVVLWIRDTLVNKHAVHFAGTGVDTLPTLVFIHGSPGSWSNYRACMWDSALLKKYRMVSIDRPGFGYSEFGDVLHLDDQALTILPIIKSLQNGKPISIFGHSMGAPVAVRIAAYAPALVDRLILAGAPLDVNQESPETWRKVMDKGALKLLLPGAFAPSNKELLYLKTDLVGLQREFSKITCRVNFYHGDKDSWVPIGNIAFGISLMTNARSVQSDTLKGAGHLIPWENQEEFLQYLRYSIN